MASRLQGLPITLRVIEERGSAFEEKDGQWMMTRPDPRGACGFLRPDRLCAIHAELGMAAKPTGCRQFPFLVTRFPDGSRRVSASWSCTAVHQRQGPALESHRQEVEQLLSEGATELAVPESLSVVPGLSWDWAEMQAFEARFQGRVEQLGWQEALFQGLISLGQMMSGGEVSGTQLEGPLSSLGQVLTVSLLKPCLYDHDRAFWASLDRGFLGEEELRIPEYHWQAPVEQLQATIQQEVGERFDGLFEDYVRALWFRRVHFLQGELVSGLLLLWSMRDILRLLVALHAHRESKKPEEAEAHRALDLVEMSLVAHSGNGALVYQQIGAAWLNLASSLHHT